MWRRHLSLRGKCEAATLSQGGMMSQFVLTVQCKAQRGIVGAIGTVLAEQGCNITDSAQFDDAATEEFFARIGFNAEDGAKIEELRAAFSVPAERFEMNWAIHDGGHRMTEIGRASCRATVCQDV